MQNEKIVESDGATTFRSYFDQACRINGIYAPHHMDGEKLKEKWQIFKEKCPENYQMINHRYMASDGSWETIMKLYYRG